MNTDRFNDDFNRIFNGEHDADENKNSQLMEGYEGQVLRKERKRVSPLRREGDKSLPKVDEQLSKFS